MSLSLTTLPCEACIKTCYAVHHIRSSSFLIPTPKRFLRQRCLATEQFHDGESAILELLEPSLQFPSSMVKFHSFKLTCALPSRQTSGSCADSSCRARGPWRTCEPPQCKNGGGKDSGTTYDKHTKENTNILEINVLHNIEMTINKFPN